MQETSKTISPSWKWLIGWVLANFLGVMIGAGFAFALAYIFSGGFGAPVANPEPANPIKIIFVGLLFGIPAGCILGVSQSLVVKNVLGNQETWLLITALGFILAVETDLIVSLFSPKPFDINLWFWIILSSFIGIFQWTTIKKKVNNNRSCYWILANIVHGSFAGLLGENWIVEGAFFWGVGSIITGLTLVWLLSINRTSLVQ